MAIALQKYAGVHCISCSEPISLQTEAERRLRKFEERSEDASNETVVPMFRLRCHGCHRESLYVPWDVVEFDGAPKGRRLRRSVRKPHNAPSARD